MLISFAFATFQMCIDFVCIDFVLTLSQTSTFNLMKMFKIWKYIKMKKKKLILYKLWLSNSTISNNASNEVFFSSQKYYCNWFPKRPWDEIWDVWCVKKKHKTRLFSLVSSICLIVYNLQISCNSDKWFNCV